MEKKLASLLLALALGLTIPVVDARSVNIGTLNYAMDFGKCTEHFPGNKPVLRKNILEAEFELCNVGYAVLYEGRYKIPKVSFALITPEQLQEAKTLTRNDIEFAPDPRLPPQYRSLPSDYTRSGLDRGHMAGNAFFGKDGQLGSFLMSNISPQLPELNREVFRKVEGDTRKYIRRVNHPVYIAVGQAHQVDKCTIEIGNSVCVIDSLWIAVYDPVNGKSWAHWMQNASGVINMPPISLKELEKRLGYQIWEIDNQ